MYMSYVLDFKEKLMEVTDENTYILTTDADVRFTHESVEALLDLMVRDPNVGAVCGRTHPLGVGPIVWYQIFDYAIGHWFQKVANHVLGSVLCSPGCFSVYRAAAIRDVLPIYSSKVDTSFDFLTKDMGEDRWLCTLMVQSGWRLDYCAAAEDSTFCPDNFDEFFKQRRRWIPSTLANLALVISQWKLTISNNYISIAFILYQALMVFSTIISPSTVILIMASGMVFAQFPIFSETAILVLLILTSVGYALICLYTSQDFQLKVAFLLTMVFALLMAFVTVGVAAQVADDLYDRSHPTTSPPTTSPVTQPVRYTVQSTKLTAVGLSHSPLPTDTWQHLPTPKPWLAETITNATTASSPTENPGPKLPANVSSLYLGGLIGIFVLAALLHLTEAYCLIHGLWYLFCLPSGYLLLIIYSICNLTDRSWGTREEKIKKVDDVPWYEKLWAKIRSICICCGPQPAPQPAVTDRVDGPPTDSEPPTSPEETDSDAAPPVQENADSGSDGASASSLGSGKLVDEPPPKSAMKQPLVRRPSAPRDGLKEDSGRLGKWRYPGDKKVTFASKLPRLHPETLVEDWLQREFQIYANNFRDGGYDSVSFIVGMTDKHLKAIGIEKRGHRKKLLMEIEKLPQIDIPQEVPENVEDWLNELGLDEYWTNFTQSGYTEPRMLEDLKIMNKETLKETFGITKPGHLDKLYKAIQKVQYPTEAQRRIRHTREETNKLQVMDLKVDNQDGGYEYQFWEGLRQLCLLPESAVFGAVEELKEKLEDLRNYTLMVFLIANGMWIILILALMRQSHLQVLGTNVLGLAFLCVYGLIIVIQFLTLLWHRVETFFHVIARAPWRRGQMHMSWAFDDENLPPPPTEADLARVRKKARRPRRPRTRRYSNQPSVSTDERGSLLSDGRPSSSYGSRERDIPHLV